jgi:hypothetical protein
VWGAALLVGSLLFEALIDQDCAGTHAATVSAVLFVVATYTGSGPHVTDAQVRQPALWLRW